MKPATEDLLQTFVREAFLSDEQADAVESQTDLFLLLDSLQILRTVLYVEQEFGVIVSDAELTAENLGSICKIVAFVSRKQRESSGEDGEAASTCCTLLESSSEFGHPVEP